ncbi:MAG: glycosyltransferase [Alphaproteobacteria bacterium]|nr:glycosyltransferase [Alphaproteobacteria bacterium]
MLFVGNSGGKESFKTALETQGARLGVADRLHFVGTCRDMPAAYKVADVVVSPTLTPEPFGRTVVEAQAMGRPVVVSDHGGHRETVIDGETGWRVAPNDAAALAAALRAALSLDERRRGTMADAGIANARDHFSNFDMCARTLSVYRELLTDANP